LFYSTVPEGIMFPFFNQIITIHDIIPVRFPDLLPRMKYHYYYNLPIILKNSRAIICDSENTKKDVINYYGIKEKPIYVIYAGLDGKKFFPREKGEIKSRFGFKDYLLFVGEMRPYKNLERTLEAFAISKLKDYKLIVCGNKDPRFFPKIEKRVKELSLTEKVFFMGYVPRELLPPLYSEAAALIFPSLYEGFGLPLLEAMACGCPLIVSNAASIPEVCGDASFYVNPYDTESISKGISQVIENKDLRNSLIQKGFERTKLFSWRKTAEEVLGVFEKTIKCT